MKEIMPECFQLMTPWDCVSLHSVKTSKTLFITKKEKPT